MTALRQTEPPEEALTLYQVAERLHLSYGTVFSKRHQIGFRLPGSRVWRVWPSELAQLGQKSNNLTRLTLRVSGEQECPSTNVQVLKSGGSLSARQAVKGLDALLAQRTAGKRRNTTTG